MLYIFIICVYIYVRMYVCTIRTRVYVCRPLLLFLRSSPTPNSGFNRDEFGWIMDRDYVTHGGQVKLQKRSNGECGKDIAVELYGCRLARCSQHTGKDCSQTIFREPLSLIT